MKLWAGRFSKEADERVNDFNSSIRFDSRMYAHDIKGSMAHAQMLGAQGIIPRADADAICDGLDSICGDLQSGALLFDPQAEDIHMFIEQELTKRIGDAGKRLHTARSRNDQVALDVRLYLRDEAAAVRALLLKLLETLCDLAGEHLETVMPGYTHLQRAQPVTLAHHLMAYASMFMRDVGRIADASARMNVCPLGSGALAGTTYPIDRAMTAAALGFADVLLVGHIGKLAKLAGGVMNTHSRYADCRTELLCAHAAVCGASQKTCAALLDAATTDACIALLDEAGLRAPVLDSLLRAVERHLVRRAAGAYRVGAVLFSNEYGLLGRTASAAEMLAEWKGKKQ